MKATGIILILLIFNPQSSYAQTLTKGNNYFLYSSNLNRVLFQEVININDSVLEIKSTIFKPKNSVSFLSATLIQKKMLLSSIDTSLESDTSRVILFDTLHYLFRPKIKRQSILLSWTRGESVVDFNSDGIDSVNNYLLDLRCFNATKRSADNEVAEFESATGLFNFERYVFLTNFWVVQYLSEQPYSEEFSLIEFNNSAFDYQLVLKKLETK
jgi:hypothetical protein